MAGHFLATLLVWLAAAPASVDRPAGFWGAHAGGTYRTRAAELVRPAADLAAPTGCEAPQASFAGTARARCIRNTLSRVDAKRNWRPIMRFILCIVLAMLLQASALAAKGSGAI